jgi:hypothetical protein
MTRIDGTGAKQQAKQYWLLSVILLASAAGAQTQVQANQVRAGQVDLTFFRDCTSSNFPLIGGPLTGTRLKIPQIARYGVALSADKKRVLLYIRYQSGPDYILTALNAAAQGLIELRYGLANPNFNLIGLDLTDVKIAPPGAGVSENGPYSKPPLVTLSLAPGGIFQITGAARYTNVCEQWLR